MRCALPAVPVLLLGPGLLGLGGCHLVDARSFVAHADRPPVVTPPPARPGRPPPPALLAIRLPAAPADWQGALKVAVELARSRKPDVIFTVETVTGAAGDPDAVAARLAGDTGTAEAVADDIVADGIDRLQVQLTAGSEPGLGADEVRVFVR